MLTEPILTYSEKIEMDKEDNNIKTEPNNMESFVWCKRWEATNKIENDYKKYQKMIYPLVLGHCSPAF